MRLNTGIVPRKVRESKVGSRSGRGRGPVFGAQSRHRREIGIRRDDRAVSQRERDRGDLNVDLHRPTDSMEFSVDSSELLRRGQIERPECQLA